MMGLRKTNLPPGWRIEVSGGSVYKYEVRLTHNRSHRGRKVTDFRWVANRAIRTFEDVAWFNHRQEEG